MSEELALIIAIVGLLVSVTSIVGFVMTRKEKGKEDGAKDGELKSNIEYIKQSMTNILMAQDKILAKLDVTNERVTRLEEQNKHLTERISKLEE